MTDRSAELLQRGAYAEAAAELRRVGELLKAQQVYERIWDFRSAAEVARERGDRVALLRLLLEAGDAAEAQELHAQVLRGDPTEQAAAEAVCAGRHLWVQAGQLAEAHGDLSRACEHYKRAGQQLDVGRLCERLGRLREAGAAYQRVLAMEIPGEEGRDRQDHQEEVAAADLGLSRIHAGLGQHEEAARHLQRARAALRGQPGEGGDEGIDRALVVSLHRVGLPGAARRVLLRLYDRKSPPPLEEFLREYAPAATAPSPAAAGPVLLGRYALDRLLGSGGMGRVYLGRDLLREHPVAIKIVSPPAAAPAGGGAPESYARFVREAHVIRGLRHPGLVQLLSFHEAEGVLVLEYMAGGTLADRRLPLPLAAARRVLLQIIDGLQAAHLRGVIHRDIKPQNIFFTATGEARLGDFGVAHLQQIGATQTAGFVGTLAYMAPEQITGAPLTFAADVYALGVTAFQIVTGRLPFPGPDFVAQHLGEPPPRASQLRPGLPPAWDRLCEQALAKDPAGRFAGLDVLRQAVDDLPLPGEAQQHPHLSGGPSPAEAQAGSDAAPAPERDDGAIRLEAQVDLWTPDATAGPGGAPAQEPPQRQLFWGTDTRLGRRVLVEEFAPGVLQGPAGARHLRWLRRMARHGGPGLQRVLRIDLSREGGRARVIYEALAGPLVCPGSPAPLGPREAQALRRLLQRLHSDGEVHGSVDRSVIREEIGPLLLVSGRGPLSWPAPDAAPDGADDLRALDALT